MIEITFNEKNLELSVKGHANHGEKGEDIVCSAVSILFYTLAESLNEAKEMLVKNPRINMEDGNGTISCVPKGIYEANVSLMYWTVLNGFELLASEYEDNIKLEILNK